VIWQADIYPSPGIEFAFDGDIASVKFNNPLDNG
jgi:hypothetical protein